MKKKKKEKKKEKEDGQKYPRCTGGRGRGTGRPVKPGSREDAGEAGLGRAGQPSEGTG